MTEFPGKKQVACFG